MYSIGVLTQTSALRFGALGWCIPYEYNQGDQFACMTFLEKHLYNGPISWPTVRFMVSEVQYGGKITDSLDRRLFMVHSALAYAAQELRKCGVFDNAAS